MQLSQNNNINLSLSQVKNNLGKTKIWEVVKQNQFDTSNRINSNGKDKTSIEIIEKFTEGLDRNSNSKKKINHKNIKENIQQFKGLNKSNINAKINLVSKNNLNLINNSKTDQNVKINIVNKKQVLINNKSNFNIYQQKNINTKQIKSEPAILIQQNNLQKNKQTNIKNKSQFLNKKKITEIQEAGHSKIVFSISNNNSEISDNKDTLIDLLTEINNKKDNDNSKKTIELSNNNIDINFHKDSSPSSNMNNFQDDFKNTLLHLINHFNTKIKGDIIGDHFGEFEIKTEQGSLSINIKRVENKLTIIINSKLIENIKGQLKKIEDSILEKMPELEAVTILANFEDSNKKKSDFTKIDKENPKTQITQNTFFKLNYLI
jgi:hypothetical protein